MIRIYPIEHFGPGVLPDPDPTLDPGFLWKGRDHLFFENGKAAIRYVVERHGLSRSDEVCILTTTDSSYVSTCVSATIFNYARISRVITDATRMIYVIHEFGMPYGGIEEVAALARSRGIPMVEDCAHTLDSEIAGRRVGTFADYAIYSLAKHLPIPHGGLLVGESLSRSGERYSSGAVASVEEAFAALIQRLPGLSAARRRHFARIRAAFPELKVVREADGSWTPYFLMFKTPEAERLYRMLTDSDVEWGRTHVPHWFAVPTQPLATAEDLDGAIAALQEALRA